MSWQHGSDFLKGFGFTEIAEAVDSECNELAISL
jgi:hypothetical protein